MSRGCDSGRGRRRRRGSGRSNCSRALLPQAAIKAPWRSRRRGPHRLAGRFRELLALDVVTRKLLHHAFSGGCGRHVREVDRVSLVEPSACARVSSFSSPVASQITQMRDNPVCNTRAVADHELGAAFSRSPRHCSSSTRSVREVLVG